MTLLLNLGFKYDQTRANDQQRQMIALLNRSNCSITTIVLFIRNLVSTSDKNDREIEF